MPEQISYLVKLWFLRYEPNALDQSDCRIFTSNISPEQNDDKPEFLHVDTNSLKLKVE